MPQRAAIVTGASRGIGRGIAQALAEDGYSITVTVRRPEGLEPTVQALEAVGGEVHAMAVNLADPEAPGEVVRAHADRFGRLDVLVNNAGLGFGANADEHQTKHLDLMADVNLRAIILFYREAIGLLGAAAAETGQSHVINLSSLAGKVGAPWLSAYSASKAGVIAYTAAMSTELAEAHIKSTALCPGFVDTDMADVVRDQIPPDHLIQVGDMVEAVRFLLRLSPGCIVPEIVFTPPGRDGPAGLS